MNAYWGIVVSETVQLLLKMTRTDLVQQFQLLLCPLPFHLIFSPITVGTVPAIGASSGAGRI